MPIRNIQHYAQTVPDLEVGRKFFTDFGMEATERDGNIILRCFGRDQDQVILTEGKRKRLHHVSFGTNADDLTELTKNIEAEGSKLLDAPSETPGDGIWFEDFDGMLTNICVAEEAPWEEGLAPTFNTPTHRPRQGARTELITDPPVRPRRLGHVVLFTSDAMRKQKFYIDVLGLALADRVADFLHFLYSPAGSDHHIVAMAQSGDYGIQHVGFEVGSADEVGMGGRQMMDKGYIHCWGPGRHGPGSNVFFYMRDPWNSVIEYFSDMDFIPEGTDWEAVDWATKEETVIWGDNEPKDFPTNFEILDGPGMH
ncbi:MAG: VOC family protein [Rhodospirillales bacterium]|jgi:catechol 2,3-dioxygenase-like lactoylglutathione lyase family enzyme